MGQPYVGEIRLVGFNFAPVGWSFCNGQVMSIAESSVLFDLIGTTYGGDGQTTFDLPNLQSRLVLGQGQGIGLSPYQIGATGGAETVTLTTLAMPTHTHQALAAPDGVTGTPGPTVILGTPIAADTIYVTGGTPTPLSPNSIAAAGGNQPHENRQPYLALNYIISLFGVFPSQN